MESIAKQNPDKSSDICGIERMEVQITTTLKRAMEAYRKDRKNFKPTGLPLALREVAAIAIKEKMQRAGLVAEDAA